MSKLLIFSGAWWMLWSVFITCNAKHGAHCFHCTQTWGRPHSRVRVQPAHETRTRSCCPGWRRTWTSCSRWRKIMCCFLPRERTEADRRSFSRRHRKRLEPVVTQQTTGRCKWPSARQTNTSWKPGKHEAAESRSFPDNFVQLTHGIKSVLPSSL